MVVCSLDWLTFNNDCTPMIPLRAQWQLEQGNCNGIVSCEMYVVE